MKKISTVNYIIAFVITVITFGITYAAAKAYILYRSYEQENYMNYLSQVMPEEIDNYIIKNHDLIIYITNSSTTNIELDKQVKKVLVDNNYVKEIREYAKKTGNTGFHYRPNCAHLSIDFQNRHKLMWVKGML